MEVSNEYLATHKRKIKLTGLQTSRDLETNPEGMLLEP
jgi:hypothetical protein